ncbi:tetratricopeptide repeat protein [Lentzea atacamensis]|uniref:Tetratricopeptide repeat protein n=1 Tax=Lentzea atacamensis TaxID=531938 RepID=A0ABX9E5Y6_9PSEU|nr:tetratricopeptide repeat protein [Lentzea atacamensis]
MEDGYNVDNRVKGSAANVVQSGSIGVMNLNMDRFALPIPAQLPRPIGTLVNQKHVLNALDDVLDRLNDKPAIVVLVGARGSGKSTAAVYWLQHHDERFPDGQLRADLGAWADHATAPSEVLLGFITSLGVKQADVPADLESRVNLFRSLTRGRSLQILLDDAVTASQVKSLLPGLGRSMVVVTGQGGFGALAENDATFIDVEPLEDEMAVELLRAFAGDRVDVEPDARAALVELCGGRAVALSVVGRVLREAPDLLISELLEELEFSGGITRVTVDGEPAIAAVLDAGYRRLSESAQRVYRTLGLHPGGEGASTAALAAVLKMPEPKLRPILRELVEGKRMVDKIDGRFRLDALVRDHARNIADDVDGSDVCELRKRAFVAWYVKGALAADAVLQPARPWVRGLFPDVVVDAEHPAHRQPREWMLAERGTLRSVAALADALGELEALQRLCVAQWWLYESEKCSDDLVATHVLGVQAAEHLGNLPVKALLLVQQGYAERTRSRFDEAARLLADGEVLAKAQGSAELVATAVEGAGLALFDRGDLDGARRLLNRNVELAERIGDARRTSLAYMHAAKPAGPEEALRLLAEAQTGFRALGRPEQHNLGKVLLWQGRKFGEQGDLSEAKSYLDRALALMTEIGREFDRAQVLDALGDVHAATDPSAARRYYAQATQVYEKAGHLVAAARSRQRASAG